MCFLREGKKLRSERTMKDRHYSVRMWKYSLYTPSADLLASNHVASLTVYWRNQLRARPVETATIVFDDSSGALRATVNFLTATSSIFFCSFGEQLGNALRVSRDAAFPSLWIHR
jgi:hypothetical protein